jgi:hypothetical protein
MASLAVLMAALGFGESANDKDAWFEVGKSGLQLGVITIVGGLVGWAVKSLQDARADRAREVGMRLDLLRDLVETYNRIKGVRRRLRASGFRAPRGGYPAATTLTPTQVAAFRRELTTLTDAQLAMEKTILEVQQQDGLFAPKTREIVDQLKTAERYVNEVIGDWENYGVEIVPGAAADKTVFALRNLQAFLGDAHAKPVEGLRGAAAAATIGGLVPSVSEPLERVEELYRTLLPAKVLGSSDGANRRPRRRLRRARARHDPVDRARP